MLDRDAILGAFERLAELLRERRVEGEVYPQFEGLRLTTPTPEYVLAMKCMASRIGAGPRDPGDVADISYLISHLGLRSATDALGIVTRYYPGDLVPPRAVYLLEDLFAAKERRP